jgi:hypothetical protein
MTHITTRDGKYAVIHENGANLRAERYGEPWRDLNGDGLVLALAQEIERLRAALHDIADMTYDSWTNGARSGEVARAAIDKTKS